MGKRLALAVFALVPVMVVTGVSSAVTTGGGTVLSPPQGSVVANAGIPVRVRLDANTRLVGTEAAVLTMSWSIAPTDQPATPDNYSSLTTPASTFTGHAV